MKSFLAVIVAVLAFAASAQSISGPAFFYGNDKYFGSETYNTKSIYSDDFSALVSSTMGQTNAPSALFVVGQSGLSTTQGLQGIGAYGNEATFSNLKTLLGDKSLTAPYLYLDDLKSLRTAVPNAEHFTRDFDNSNDCSAFVKYIENAMKASEGKTAVIAAQTKSSIDACLPKINEALKTATSNKYAVGIVGTTDVVSASAQPTTSQFIGPQYVTAQTVYGLTISIFLLVAVWIAIQCTLSIQTPLRYASPNQLPPHTKDY